MREESLKKWIFEVSKIEVVQTERVADHFHATDELAGDFIALKLDRA
jgi:hypothetical protein